MKKVLLIAHKFPPRISSESIQTLRCVKFLPSCGWQPIVLTVEEALLRKQGLPLDHESLAAIPLTVRIERVPRFQTPRLVGLLRCTYPSLLTMHRVPLHWLYWWPVRRGLGILRDEKVDVIYSRSNPPSSHLVALGLKRRVGLSWVAHFSDPWIDNPYRQYAGPKDREINVQQEKLVIETADALIFTTEETRQVMLEKYPSQFYAKSFVIPNCYDPDLSLPSAPREMDTRLTMVHVGSIYGARSPLALLQALENLVSSSPELAKELCVVFVGELSPTYKRMISEKRILSEIILTLGVLPPSEAHKYMASADVLLSIEAPSAQTNLFLPAKVVEYIGLGKPILGLSPLDGTSADLIRTTGGMVVDPTDVDGTERALRTLYDRFENGSLQAMPVDSATVSAFDARNTTRSLIQVFDWVQDTAAIEYHQDTSESLERVSPHI